MSKLISSSRLASLFSTAGTWGEAQIVATHSRNVVLDLQTRNYDSSGILHRHHATANLPLATAMRVRDLLSAAIENALDMSAAN